MLAKSTLVLFVLAISLSLSLNGNPSVVSAVPTKLSHTGNVDPVSYYEAMYKSYFQSQHGKSHGDETYQDQNTLQQSGSDVENHFGSEVEQKNIYEASEPKVGETFGSKTFQSHNTYQQLDTKGKNYVGSRTFQEGNIYKA